eukprot:1872309-Pyramimonas_sp.AAC.1
MALTLHTKHGRETARAVSSWLGCLSAWKQFFGLCFVLIDNQRSIRAPAAAPQSGRWGKPGMDKASVLRGHALSITPLWHLVGTGLEIGHG